MADWLDPLNRILWQKAVKKKATTVRLRDGRKFNIVYNAHNNTVVFKPHPLQHSFVPFGTFDIKIVLDPLWLTGELSA